MTTDVLIRETHTVAFAEDIRIDKERGIIYAVKVNGNKSENGRRYRDPVLDRATPLYEGAKVYGNHTEQGARPGSTERRIESMIGRLKNVRHQPGGNRADLHVLPSKRSIIEDIEADPGAFGLSHVVDAATAPRRNEQGEEEITRIAKVHSVDVVANPATTSGMFEQRTNDESQPPDQGKEQTSMEVQKLLEGKVAEREREIATLKEASGLKVAEIAVLAALVATHEGTITEQATKLAVAEQKVADAEAVAHKAEIAKAVKDAGLADKVAESLSALSMDKAKAIIATLKGSASRPRSEGRTGTSATPDAATVTEVDFLAAVSG